MPTDNGSEAGVMELAFGIGLSMTAFAVISLMIRELYRLDYYSINALLYAAYFVADARLLGVLDVLLDGIVCYCFLKTSFVELRFEPGLSWLRLCLLLFDMGWWVKPGAPVRDFPELLSYTFYPG